MVRRREVWGRGGAGTEGSGIRDFVVIVVVLRCAIHRWGGVGERAIEGPLRFFGFGGFGGEGFTVVRFWRRKLVGRPMATLRAVGGRFGKALLGATPPRFAMDIEEKAEHREDKEGGHRHGDGNGDFGVPAQASPIRCSGRRGRYRVIAGRSRRRRSEGEDLSRADGEISSRWWLQLTCRLEGVQD